MMAAATCERKQFESYSDEIRNLILASIEIRQKAYAPYSNFKVGAAVLDTSGTIFAGCNVENAAYPVSMCAEKSAISRAVSDGSTKYVAVAVCGAFQHSDEFVSPCGNCRQTINEFCDKEHDIRIYLTKPNPDTIVETTLKKLLPLSFYL